MCSIMSTHKSIRIQINFFEHYDDDDDDDDDDDSIRRVSISPFLDSMYLFAD